MKSGVIVDLQGAEVLHRVAVIYPAEALQRGIEGEVLLSATLDADGNVTDVRPLSGPEELHDASAYSVRQWHFVNPAGATTRQIRLRFDAALQKEIQEEHRNVMQNSRPPRPYTPHEIPLEGSTVAGVSTSGISDAAARDLLDRLPIRSGDRVTGELIRRAQQVVHGFDPHLILCLVPAENRVVNIEVRAPSYRSSNFPQRIKLPPEDARQKLISGPAPRAPQGAAVAGRDTTVSFDAVIAKDGTVMNLGGGSGPAELKETAEHAVRDWLYAPVLLNGNPVEVATRIEVKFEASETGELQ